MTPGTGPNNHNLSVIPELSNPNNKIIKLASIPLYREDVIFESNGESFLPGEYRSIIIINNLNNITNNCKTIAKCVTDTGQVVEKTSDNLAQLIGQAAYNILFYALCSVINPEYRIKAILSVLTVKKTIHPEVPTAKPTKAIPIKRMANNDKSCQTDETRLEFKKRKDRRRIRKVLVPYVVKPDEVKQKKITIDPYAGKIFITPDRLQSTEQIECFIQNRIQTTDVKFNVFEQSSVKTENVESPDIPEEAVITCSNTGSSLPDIGPLDFQDDNSNDSSKTFKTVSDSVLRPLLSLVNNVDEHTKENDPFILPNHPITLMDGNVIRVPFKPEDNLHIASKENLQFLDETNRKKLLLHQMQIDFKYSVMRDDDGNLFDKSGPPLAPSAKSFACGTPLDAVIPERYKTRDHQGLRLIAPCLPQTALKLSLFRETADATRVLLSHGADPSLTDSEHSTSVHLAAELRTDHLSIILHHCKLNARSDSELSAALLHYMCCTLYDKQGYTPLMLASKLGHYENVRLLLETTPTAVDLPMPNSGNTALFLAIHIAFTERGNKSKVVDHFRKTLEALLEYGADPSVENHCGANVNLLLQEFECAELALLIGNKVANTKFFKGEMDLTKNFDKFILLKEGNNVSIQEMDIKKTKVGTDKNTVVKIVKKNHANSSPITKEYNKAAKKVSQVKQKSDKVENKILNVNDIPVNKAEDNKPTKIDNKANKNTITVDNRTIYVNDIPVQKTQDSNPAKSVKPVKKKPVMVEDILIYNNIPVYKAKDNKPAKKDNLVNKKPAIVDNKIVIVDDMPVNKAEDNKPTEKENPVNKKPFIVENILLKTPVKVTEKPNAKITVDNNVNSKDFLIKPSMKLETVSCVKKVIWCAPKRKAEDEAQYAKKARINK
ncbi:putative B-cell lymphoma 3-encoded protein [Operophtera brumata]|uniref:Putative B-cell lymphoma 3-encoded protein n=1 Tax=Operophtera brumata TaxID=104452 RepID=A0A0L7LTE2_OPEBR|nr:putative B-cell lymphoma 3-encoded protein [Operophtera brumata]